MGKFDRRFFDKRHGWFVNGPRNQWGANINLHIIVVGLPPASSSENNTNLLNLLKNIYLAFEALIDHQFAYPCWLWGKYPQIVTYDACMKLSSNFVTRSQLEASRPEQKIDVDLISVLLQLSILSPFFFVGARVQFVVGAGETAGSSPAWVGPGNRMSGIFNKSQRGSTLRAISKGVPEQEGNGDALLEELRLKEKGIGDIGGFKLNNLKELFKMCFTTSISK